MGLIPRGSWACVPRLLKPVRLESVLHHERSVCTTAREAPPLAATRESPPAVKTQHSQKCINLKKKVPVSLKTKTEKPVPNERRWKRHDNCQIHCTTLDWILDWGQFSCKWSSDNWWSLNMDSPYVSASQTMMRVHSLGGLVKTQILIRRLGWGPKF